MKCALAVGVGLMAMAVNAAPKAILLGWDIGSLPPAMVLSRINDLEKLPFDGACFKLTVRGKNEHNGYSRVSCGNLWSREELKPFIPAFRAANGSKFVRESFISFYFFPTKRISWKDDAAWHKFAENTASAAWLARECGLKGVHFDPEDYWGTLQFDLHPDDGMTYAEAAVLARKRGAEVFRRAFEEYPEMTILTCWWLSRNYGWMGSQDLAASVRGAGDLMVPFTDGLLDVMPMTARFFDGNEHTYHWLFRRSYANCHVFDPEVLAPENRLKYRALFGVAPAFYFDMYTCPKSSGWYRGPVGGRRLNALLDRYAEAVNYSDGYIWLFGERHSVIDWGKVDYPVRFAAPFTNGTWEAAMPGFYKEMAILRNPRGQLMPRLEQLLASGEAVDLAGPVSNNSVKVTGVKYGEWYAAVVEADCETPKAGCSLRAGARDIWGLPTASVVFEESTAGKPRRGVAFQRIWDNADTLRVSVGTVPFGKPPKNVKISVYKVFAPNENAGRSVTD